MKKHLHKKVIIITFVIAVIIVSLIFYQRSRTQSNAEALAQQYIATKSLELPNGSKVIAEINYDQNVHHGWIGVNLSELSTDIKSSLQYTDNYGVYVQDTQRDSPAQTAGLLPGDIIVQIDNKQTQEVLGTIQMIATLTPGKAYQFLVFRQGKYLEYQVSINERP